MDVDVRWKQLRGDGDPGWNQKRVLYAYLSTDLKEVLYLGKAYENTVRQRWNYSAMKGFWEGLENQRGITNHVVIVGEIVLPRGVLLSEEIATDIEDLLTERIQPWGNMPLPESHPTQKDLCVRCTGGWGSWEREYVRHA